MFIQLDTNNNIIGVTSQQPPLGESIEVDDNELIDYGNFDYIFKYVGNKVIKIPRVKSVDELRANAYPSIQNQLDMLWHAMDTGEIPKATAWYNSIKAVKDTYPKV